jgi:hypothetical protein
LSSPLECVLCHLLQQKKRTALFGRLLYRQQLI